MTSGETRNRFTPEDLKVLSASYHDTLKETRGRPGWKRELGPGEMRTIAAEAIMSSARQGCNEADQLREFALRAIRASFLQVALRSS